MRIGFVSGLNDHKLGQKLAPLQAMDAVEEILLFRRAPYAGAKVTWLPVPAPLRQRPVPGDLWRLAQLLRHGRRCDLLIGCHQYYHGVMAALVGAVHRKPVVQLLITSGELAWSHPASRWALRRAAAIGCRGWRTMDFLRQRLGDVTPALFVHTNVLAPMSLPVVGDIRDLDVLYVGGFEAYKNPLLLVEVLAGLKARRGVVRAALVGGGSLSSEVRERLAGLGLLGDVLLPGHLAPERLEGWYARARLLLLTSRHEGLPMVIPEAFRHGVPVVVSDVGEVADLVRHGENGFLVGRGDVAGFVAACSRVLDEPGLAFALGECARRDYGLFVEASSLERVMGEWRGVLGDGKIGTVDLRGEN